MANENPIYLGEDGAFVNFKIPAANLQDEILLSIEFTLLDEGWDWDADHVVILQSHPDDLYNNEQPPDKLAIGTGTDIRGKKLRCSSRIRRIRNGADENKPSRVQFTVKFFANDILLDSFTRTSDHTNPESFFINTKFK